MPNCLACGRALREQTPYCPYCGAVTDASESPTGTAPTPRTPGAPAAGLRTPAAPRTGSDAKVGVERFAPGTMLTDRFRIVGLLGRGGMGEVYRADDLKLGQAVALKFLPENLAGDAERLARLMSEVRLARQVSHPNVCRVYDVGEIGGDHFLSMEFVDGEDVASLLRRIGRLPGDKALEIARQLCAGLAAAHDRGVLHRDLKPENVMLDGRGKVRITDFGLATASEGVAGAEALSGTPAYMSPEQLAGREATVLSDIYALGLVLYELFTGRRAFEGRTLAELTRQHARGLATPPSAAVKDLDPAVEQTILSCLSADPSLRPASAIAVAASLPGSDPLAAALAAGETPSPAMVAAAGGEPVLRPLWAWTLGVLLVLGVAAQIMLSGRLQLFRVVPLDKPPAVLEDRARGLLASLRVELSGHHVSGFAVDNDYLRRARSQPSSDRWKELAEGRPPVMAFWYRQSPRPLISSRMSGRVSASNPSLVDSNMAGVRLDTTGRLLEFYRVPLQHQEPGAPDGRPAFDWAKLFAEARLDPAAFRSSVTEWTPYVSCDTYVAWEGSSPDWPGANLRVEAGSWKGEPTWFKVFAPWKRAERQAPMRRTAGQVAANAIGLSLLVLGLTSAGLIARRNLRLGRGDRRGAVALAAIVTVGALATWALDADHVSNLEMELDLFARGLAQAALMGAFVAVVYLALEPQIRRLWPHALISWTRLLSGRLSDTLVGAHVLYGIACGLAMSLVQMAFLQIDAGRHGPESDIFTLDTLLGLDHTLQWVLERAFVAIGVSLVVVLLFAAVRHVLRWQPLAALVAISPLVVQEALADERPLLIVVPLAIVVLSVPLIALARFGLVAMMVTFFTASLLNRTPLTPSLSDWSAGPTQVVLLVLGVLAFFAGRAATRRDPALVGSSPSRG
jgi:hypothetical protein